MDGVKKVSDRDDKISEEKRRADDKISEAHKYAGTAGALAAGLAGVPHPHLGGVAAHAGLEGIRVAKHAQIEARHSDDPEKRAIADFLEWDQSAVQDRRRAEGTQAHSDAYVPLVAASAATPTIVTVVRGILKIFD